jgi:hypothetical protein
MDTIRLCTVAPCYTNQTSYSDPLPQESDKIRPCTIFLCYTNQTLAVRIRLYHAYMARFYTNPTLHSDSVLY